MSEPTFRIKRVYDEPAPEDGFRVLVDRLWPRGVTKEHVAADLWLKEVAPSAALRGDWHHDPDRFGEFTDRYRAELESDPAVAQLLDLARTHGVVTLLFSAHDPELNQAAVLRDYLREALESGRGRG